MTVCGGPWSMKVVQWYKGLPEILRRLYSEVELDYRIENESKRLTIVDLLTNCPSKIQICLPVVLQSIVYPSIKEDPSVIVQLAHGCDMLRRALAHWSMRA